MNTNNFKDLRQKSGLSLRAVANRTSLAHKTVANAENGHNITISTYNKLKNFYEENANNE